MKSRSLLAAVVCLFSAATLAQDAPVAGERSDVAETARGEPLAPRRTRDDVRLLRTLSELELTTEQIAKIIPLLQEIRTHLTAIAARRAKTHTAQRGALANARSALIRGETPRQSTYDTIQSSLRQLQISTQTLQQRVLQVESRIQAELTERQLLRIETREQREARLTRVRELEGETTARAYVVKKLQETRELLPDQYARIRLRLANELAVKTEGPRSPRFNAYRQRVLATMDQAYQWTAAHFQAQLPTLEQAVEDALEMRSDADAPSAEGLIPYEQYAGAIRNPRTRDLAREMLDRRGGGRQ